MAGFAKTVVLLGHARYIHVLDFSNALKIARSYACIAQHRSMIMLVVKVFVTKPLGTGLAANYIQTRLWRDFVLLQDLSKAMPVWRMYHQEKNW